MFAATVMLFILEALFGDLEFDFILPVLHQLFAFIVFGLVTFILAYGFHPQSITYAMSFIYGPPRSIPTVNIQPVNIQPVNIQPVNIQPVNIQPVHPEPALLAVNNSRQTTELPRMQVNEDKGHNLGKHRTIVKATDDFQHAPSYRDSPSPNTGPPYCLPHLAPMAMALRRKTLAKERRSGKKYTEYVAPPPPTAPTPTFDINSAAQLTPPSPANATVTPPPPAQPTFVQLRETAFTLLHSTSTHPLAVDLHYRLAPGSEYWNVIDKVTGLTIGIVDQAGHLGHAISTFSTIFSQTGVDLSTKRILKTLVTYTFNPLPRDLDGSYPNITLGSQVKYIDVRDLDGAHCSLVAQDSRLCKALGLFPSSDFTTSATTISDGPHFAAAVSFSDAEMVNAASPVIANTVLADVDMVDAPPVTADTNTTDATSVSLDNTAMVDVDTAHVDAAPTVEDTPMADASAPTIGDSDLTDTTSVPMVVDSDSDSDFNMNDNPSVITTTIVMSAIPFSHTGLTAREMAKVLTTTAVPDPSDQFEGPCTVSWDGPSGLVESGPLTLKVNRFLDEELMVPMNDSVYNFKQADGTLFRSFTVLKAFSSFQSGDGRTTFPFRFQRVGPEESREVVDLEITMTAAVADEFSLLTGAALPAH